MIKLRQLRCSFCGKNETEVLKLVAGKNGYICDKCVAIATRIMEGDSHNDNQPHKVDVSVWRRLFVHAKQFLRGSSTHRFSSTRV